MESSPRQDTGLRFGNLRNDKGELLLPKKYEAISDLSERSVLSCYLNPAGIKFNEYIPQDIFIFPFGCNSSQYKAVIHAFTNRVSVIQGPPGTGKTQTILNIIANAIIRGKTVQVVSNNNSATENVIEKLASPQYRMDFIAENGDIFYGTPPAIPSSCPQGKKMEQFSKVLTFAKLTSVVIENNRKERALWKKQFIYHQKISK